MSYTAAARRGDLTQGPIARQLVAYSIPLLLGNLLQQLYTMADSIVVGNFVSKQALAAVGATTTIVNTLVGFFIGISVGVSVVVSQYYGANDVKNLRRAIHSTLVVTLLLSIACTFVGIGMTDFMLDLMDTPADVYGEAHTYLTVYFSGVAGLIFYNTLSGILRAMGDSKRPLYFLLLCCILNILLDIVFVVVIPMGVAGTAIATILSQFISAAAIFFLMCTTKENWRLRFSEMRIDWAITRRIFAIGMPTAINSAIINLSNVVVTAFINAFGSDCMAGWSAYHRIHNVIFLPMQSISMAATTFAGQNFGARTFDRLRRGYRTAHILVMSCSLVLAILVIWACKPLVMIFNTDPGVVWYGTLFLYIQIPLMLLHAASDAQIGILRGLGDTRTPTLIMTFSYVVVRQIYLHLLTPLSDSIYVICFAYPIGWLVCTIIVALYYPRKYKKLVEAAQAQPA